MEKINATYFKQCSLAMAIDGQILQMKRLEDIDDRPLEPCFESKKCLK